MAITIPQGLKITTNQPVDSRLVLTKAEMLAMSDATMPLVYLAVCSDDKKLYLYNKNSTPESETGKFHVQESGGSTSGDKTFKFEQAVNSKTWIIQHNLSKYPSVTSVESYGGNELIGDVIYIDENNLKIEFSLAVSGYAFLN